MKDIHISFVPQGEQRYPTVGDYGETENTVWFKVTDMGNPAYSWAIMLHELVEKYLKDKDGITDAMVDAWDLGGGRELDDPGLSPQAPYHTHHMSADVIERIFIILSREDWVGYEEAISELFGDNK